MAAAGVGVAAASAPAEEGRASYLDVAPHDLPLALADLHRTLAVDAPVGLDLAVDEERATAVVTGAGFRVDRIDADRSAAGLHVEATRLRTLPDTVGPGMRLLLCGLNPSVYSADRGAGFARPGNRFWPAALAAGVVSRDRDPRHALVAHRVGMTDLVKRATPRADELTAAEYGEGVDRVRRLVDWLRPAAVCVIGLSGWRAVVDRKATAGPQGEPLGGRPVYLMPNTSGINAHARLDDLTAHLRAAAALADASS